MFHIIGLSLLLLWSLGLLVPYTPAGFIGILLIIATLNLLFKKIVALNPLKIRIYKRLALKLIR